MTAFALGCATENPGTNPPGQAFYYPVSVVLSDPTTPEAGFLYVVSSNFALRYNRGTVIAVDLAKLGPMGGGAEFAVVSPAPAVDEKKGHVFIGNFGGKLSRHPSGTLFVPARGDDLLFAIRANGGALSCWEEGASQDCLGSGIPLEVEGIALKQPFATAVLGDSVYVTHLASVTADGKDAAFLARLDAANPTQVELLPLETPSATEGEPPVFGPPTADITTSGDRLFVTDAHAMGESPVRAVEAGSGDVKDLGIYEAARIYDARAVAATADGARLFITTRGSLSSSLPPAEGPDGMLIADFDAATVTTRVRDFVPLPRGAGQMAIIERPGHAPLVAVSCLDSDSVAFYDDELGEVVHLVGGISRPYSLAVGALLGGGARLYVAAFASHSVDVIDLPDPLFPQGAKLVGRIFAPRGASR